MFVKNEEDLLITDFCSSIEIGEIDNLTIDPTGEELSIIRKDLY